MAIEYKEIDDWFDQHYSQIQGVIKDLSDWLDKLNDQLNQAKSSTSADAYLQRAKLTGDITNTKNALAAAKQEYETMKQNDVDEVTSLFYNANNQRSVKERQYAHDHYTAPASELVKQAYKLMRERYQHEANDIRLLAAKVDQHADEISMINMIDKPRLAFKNDDALKQDVIDLLK
ncbi:hypothetical protein [Lacticaseibacillus sp. 866-1]|uniref:hypothetical protein n=1 Tax=Lacticaseibacillus sp. 866-1 TaxID=2799576 RepID=UPI0019420A02|nr:hypothetical protein [Lacticaseibacillus sp. 866-1]